MLSIGTGSTIAAPAAVLVYLSNLTCLGFPPGGKNQEEVNKAGTNPATEGRRKRKRRPECPAAAKKAIGVEMT